MLINLLQRHYLWIFVFLSGLCGLTLGHLAATSVKLLARPLVTTENIRPALPGKTSVTSRLSDYQDILTRDIFNSAGGSQNLTPAQPAQTPNKKIAKTASKWSLIGTISGGNTPLATLSNGKKTTTFHLHQELPDGASLSLIQRNRVELSYPDGHAQVLELTQAKLPSSVSTKQRQTKSSINKMAVESLGENRWLIPARVAEDTRSNVGDLLKQAQAIPYLEGNRTTGFQIRMIQRGSLIEQIGLRKGDILREVNGIKLNSPEKALQVFGQLRQAKQISISLERRGKAMTFAYEIR